MATAVVLAAAACSSELPADLGDYPQDLERLVDAPALAHLALALPETAEADELTVEDLFRERPAYARAPDPSLLLDQMRIREVSLPPLGPAEPLRVLSFNAGLLDRWYPFTTVQVPYVDVRRERSPAIVLGDDWDIVLLQEVWDTRDVEAFTAEARTRGYLAYAGSTRAHEEHGLLMLVREELVDPDGPNERREQIFEQQRGIEDFPGPGIARGFLSWRFRHAPTGVTLNLFDTHTTAFPELSLIRETQVRRLGLAARSVPDDEVALVAGDVNAGAYYPRNTFGEVDGEPVTDWWRNAQAYALLLHYGGLYDVFAAAGEARDVELMDQLPAYTAAYRERPLGNVGLCDELGGVFTATDCNSLYFEQYGGTEYPARIDHVMVRDESGAVRVSGSWVAYDGVMDGGVELSDHYGVGAVLWVERR
ncbi:MAG: endonuclease/exonuclease/phosphatase family protein [Nannocystaceae bacterium]